MHASNNKFTMVMLSLLSLARMQGDRYQRGFKPFGDLGQVNAQTRANIPNPAVDVQLKIQIKEQLYCHNRLQMVLSLDFINTGKDRLIFFRSGHRIAEYAISRTQEDALANKYELGARRSGTIQIQYDRSGTGDFLDDITPLIDTPVPSDDFFIVIPPGDFYRSEKRLTIPIHVNESTQQADLSEGEHFLEVTLVTWPDIDMLPDKLRERWKGYGHLYSKGITSSPVSFTFFNTETDPCPR
jgi:hypothetical protein